MMIDFDNFKQFILNLNHFSESSHLVTIDKDINNLNQIISRLKEINTEKNNFEKLNATNFNIFKILRYGHYETRLHTPLLADLLNPNGHHQLKDSFFIQMIRFIYKIDFRIEEISDISIIEELVTNHLDGRIDIYIRFKYAEKYFHVAIENKINADDQPEQLERYWNYLSGQSLSRERLKLVYLTKRGTSPSIPWSISKQTIEHLQEQNVYLEMSHSKDIAFFIDEILNKKDVPPTVYYSLQQYKQILLDF